MAVSFPYAGARVSVQISGRVEVQTDAGEGGGDPEGLGTDADLQSRLQGLLVAAHCRGIRVRGGWDIRNERRFPDWDIHITEVVKPDTRGRSHDG